MPMTAARRSGPPAPETSDLHCGHPARRADPRVSRREHVVNNLLLKRQRSGAFATAAQLGWTAL